MNSPTPGLYIKVRHLRDDDETVACARIYVHNPHTHLPDFIPLIPAKRSARNQAAASVHRFACEMPPRDAVRMRDFVAYARAFITHWFEPLLPHEMLTFEEWLAKTQDRKSVV